MIKFDKEPDQVLLSSGSREIELPRKSKTQGALLPKFSLREIVYKPLKQKMMSLYFKPRMTQFTEHFRRVSVKKSLCVNSYIQLFIINILRKTKYILHMTQYHYELLNDRSIVANTKEHENQSVGSNYLLHAFPLLRPENYIKWVWDILALCCRLYFLYMIPIELAWLNQRLLFGEYLNASIAFLTIIIVDQFVGLNTVYYKNGLEVTDRLQIFQQYLTRYFGMMWVSSFIVLAFLIVHLFQPDLQSINSNAYYIVLLLFLVHHLEVHEVSDQYEQALNLGKKASSYLELVKLVLLLFYVIHLFSCLWFWAGQYSQDMYGISWMSGKDILNAEWNVQYLQSVYFSCVTMFTVGYGDSTPQSNLEKIVTIIFILTSSIQLPYSVNTVGGIIDRLSRHNEAKKKKTRTINSFMQRKRIPLDLQYKVRQYLSFFWLSSIQKESKHEKEIIGQLSENLRDQLITSANMKILENAPLFRDYFSKEFKHALVTNIKQHVVQPSQIVKYPNDENQIFLCFIDEGDLEVFIDNGSTVRLSTITGGQCLGMQSFITGKRAAEQYKSIGFTRVMLLTRQEFLKTLKDYPSDYETYCKIRDDFLYNPEVDYLKIQCYSCFSYHHKLINCPMLHYNPSRELVIKKYSYNHQQKRQPFQRRKKSTHILAQSQIHEIQRLNPKEVKFYQMSELAEKEVSKNESVVIPRFKQVLHKLSPFKPIKQKFIDTVNKVRLYNHAKEALYAFKHQHVAQAVDPKIIKQYLKMRIDNLDKYPKYADEVENLIIRLRNLKRYDAKQMEGFEQNRNYSIYYPNQNVYTIIEAYNMQNDNELYLNVLSKYQQYMLYPGKFLQKFKIYQSNIFQKTRMIL